MNDGKRYLFYDAKNGEIILEEARNRLAIMPSVERVVEIYPALHDRLEDSYDVLILDFDSYAQDFAECNGYRVNPETKELEFSYPDPNEPEAGQPYQAPLNEKVAELETKQEATDAVLLQLMMEGMM